MEAHHIYFIIGAIVLCTAPVLLLVVAHLETTNNNGTKSKQMNFNATDIWRQLREENTQLASLSQLLRRAGLFKSDQQMRATVYTLVASTTLAVTGGAYAFSRNFEFSQLILSVLGSLLVMLLISYSLLKKVAEERQSKLESETLMLIQTTRMLWRVGLSLPKTLAIICDELSDLTPNCAKELNLAVNKIESGQSQEEALYELINSTSAEGFKEYLIVIRQQSITGGSIDKSLNELYSLLQNRRRLDLQETVNKLSGKMSLVMMVFLFPALLIFAAGPSFMSLTSALSGMGN
ncbi:type II secretion system protein F [Spongiibacter sp. IMCC21906]|uniref:type II secretion system F family protein n=1 Tax=Spongiibacter sp. IMCC21906 TaxID=1620392 RepID=UPI00062DDB97|nr:type II secretion system F family protein [Spongiibacter sp. IMCC21906]AKH69585.1 type II secretion system protein F [Spongiibacter sp. IMCC21906]